LCAFVVGGEDAGVGPLAGKGAVEAFDLAVGPRAVRSGRLEPDAQVRGSVEEDLGAAVVLGVIGEDPFDGDAVGSVERGRAQGQRANSSV
jgi:hypothetical protein